MSEIDESLKAVFDTWEPSDEQKSEDFKKGLAERAEKLGTSAELPPTAEEKSQEALKVLEGMQPTPEEAPDIFAGRDAIEKAFGPIEDAPTDKGEVPRLYEAINAYAPTLLKREGIDKILTAFASQGATDFALELTGSAIDALKAGERIAATEQEIWYNSKLAQGTNPHEEAEIQEFSRRFGIPEGTARRDINRMRYHANTAAIQDILAAQDEDGNPRYPVLLNFMRDPQNFKLAGRQQEVKTLSRLESLMVDSFGSAFEQDKYLFTGTAKRTLIGAIQGVLNLLPDKNVLSGERSLPDYLLDLPFRAVGLPSISERKDPTYINLFDVPEFRYEPLKNTTYAQDVIGFTGQLAVTIPAYIAGGPLAGGGVLGLSVFADERQQMIDEGVPDDKATLAAMVSATGQGTLDALQLKWLLRPFRRLIGIEGKPFRTFLYGLLRFGGGASVEAPQGMISDVSNRAAKAKSSEEFWDGLPAFLKKSFIRNLYDVLVVLPVGTILGGGRMMYDVRRAKELAPTYKAYDALMTEAAASEVRQATPEKFEAEVAQPLAEKIGDPPVIIERDEWRAHFQADPAGEAEFAKKLGISEQVGESATSNADISVPLAKWVTVAAGTPHVAALRPWTRFGIHDVAPGNIIKQSEQIDAFMKEMGAEIQAGKVEAEELTGKAKELYDQIRAAGYSKQKAEDAVELVRAFGGRMAAKIGVLPAEWWEKHTPQVRAMEFDEYQKQLRGVTGEEAKPEAAAPKVAPAVEPAAPAVEALPALPAEEEPKKTEELGTTQLADFTPQEVPIERIKLSKEVPNFKRGASPETGVVPGQALQGKYERVPYSAIILWERLNGDLEVITGRHRLDLARRSGEKTIPAQIVRESAGFTKEMALALDAEANIKDEKGTVEDYARYFRKTNISREAATERGLISRRPGRDGYDIGVLASDDLYTAFVNGAISAEKAAAIARAAPNDARIQAAAMVKAAKKTPDELTAYVRYLKQLPPGKKKAGEPEIEDMFGFDDSAIKAAEAHAKQVAAKIAVLREIVRTPAQVLKHPKTAKKLGIDPKDPEALRKAVEDAKQRIYEWETYGTVPPDVSTGEGAQFQGEGGRPPLGAYIPAQKLIAIFKGKNDSTIIHELMHYFMDEMRAAAAASPEIAEMVAALEKYGDEEKIAKAFERYMRDGKAPSSILRRAFARFRQWLLAVYRQVAGLPEIDEEVRGVFDRMLASEEEIAEARLQQRDRREAGALLRQLIDEAALPPEEREKLRQAEQAGREKAVQKRTQRALAAYRSARKGNKDNLKAAEAAVAEDPFYRFIDAATAAGGINRDEAGPQAKGVSQKFPGLFKEGGKVSLADALVALGLDSPEALRSALEAAESVKDAVARIAAAKEAQDEREFLEEVDVESELDLLTDDSLEVARLEYEVIAKVAAKAQKAASEEEAKQERAAVRGEERAKAKEEKQAKTVEAVIERAGKQIENMAFGFLKKLNIGAAKAKAKQDIRNLTVRDATDVRRFIYAADRASLKAIQAAREGDYTEALAAKHIQVHNLAMAIEAANYKKQIFARTLALKRLLQASVASKVLDAYQQQVIALERKYGLSAKKERATTPFLTDFLNARTADGKWAPDIQGWQWLAGSTGYKNLKLSEFETLDWLLSWLSKEGQDLAVKIKLEKAATIGAVAELSAAPAAGLKGKDVIEKHQAFSAKAKRHRIAEAEKTQLFTIARMMDAYSNVGKNGVMGPNEGGWYAALNKAESDETKMWREFGNKVAARIYKDMKKLILASMARRGATFAVGNLPVARNAEVYQNLVNDGRGQWDFEMLFLAALNLGNDGNQRAFMKGYGFDEQDIETIKGSLTDAEWDGVIAIWKSYEFFRPELAKVYERTTGKPLKIVEPKSFAVFTADGKFKTIDGGYHPLIFDSKLDPTFAGQEELDLWKQSESIFTMGPEVYNKMTIERTGGVRPPKLSFNVINRHWQHAAHYITHSEAVREADAVTSHSAWRAQAVRVLGQEMYDKIRPALKEMANTTVYPFDTYEHGAKKWRGLAYTWLLAYKFASAIAGVTAAVNSLPKLGMWNYLKAVVQIGKSFVAKDERGNLVKWLYENSGRMQERLSFVEKDWRDAFSRLGTWDFGSGASKIRLTAEQAGEFGIKIFGFFDAIAVYPAFLAHYNAYKDKHKDASTDPDALHAAAINYAEVMIGAEQPTPSMLHRTWLQQNAGSIKQFLTFFITPSLKYYNRSRLYWKAYKAGKIGPVDMLKHLVYEQLGQPFLFGTAVHLLATGEAPDKEDVIWMLLGWWLSPFPVTSLVAGTVASTMMPGTGRSEIRTPMLLPLEKISQAAKTMARDQLSSTDSLMAAATIGEIYLKVPAVRMMQTAYEGIEEIEEGVESPIRLLTAPLIRKDYRHRERE